MRKLAPIDVLSLATVLAVAALTLPHRPTSPPVLITPAITADTTPTNPDADAPRYQLLDLGAPKGSSFFGASASSPNCRYITGYAGKRVGDKWEWRAVLRTSAGFHDLAGPNTSAETTLVTGVNDGGIAAGITIAEQSEPHAVVWSNGKMHRLFPEEGDTSAAFGVDRFGNIFGARVVGDEVRAFIRTPKERLVYFKNKPGQSTICYAASDEKQFLVRVYDTHTERYTALLWDKDGTHELPALAEDQISIPLAVNASGKIVGCCLDNEDNLFATRWKEGKPAPIRLPDSKYGVAVSVNAPGAIVGTIVREDKSPSIPFLRQKGKSYNLNDLVDNKADLRQAIRVTDSDNIIATGAVGGEPHTFLLQPK